MTDEKRPCRMKRRAELEQPTRLRITESAVALHGQAKLRADGLPRTQVLTGD
jgi:hypothetical protein